MSPVSVSCSRRVRCLIAKASHKELITVFSLCEKQVYTPLTTSQLLAYGPERTGNRINHELMPSHIPPIVVVLGDDNMVEMTRDLQSTLFAVGSVTYTERLLHSGLQSPRVHGMLAARVTKLASGRRRGRSRGG